MDKIKVSVIVPVYNLSKYISSTLDSVINQDFNCYEVIVVDDGSTDDSLQIINEKMSKSLIEYKVIHQENSGVSSARNRGIKEARGDYLVFVDGDDYITGNHLSELYNGESDFSMIQLIRKDGDRMSTPHHFSKKSISCEDLIRMELKMDITLSFCQLMYKKSIIDENGILFDTNSIYGEDIEFALKALVHGRDVSISNEATYYYIQREDSAIRTSDFRRFEIVNIYENMAEMYESMGKNDLAKLIRTSRIPRAIFGNMNYFFYNSYDFDEVMAKMKELGLFEKLSRFEGDKKFKYKIRLFLLNPKIYYNSWKKLKNSID